MKKAWIALFIIGFIFGANFFSRILFAVPGDITLTQDVATIEAEVTQHVATKSPEKLFGYLVNAGANTIWINTAGGTVVTTDAQAVGVIGLTKGSSMPLSRLKSTFSYKTATGTSVLYWFPSD